MNITNLVGNLAPNLGGLLPGLGIIGSQQSTTPNATPAPTGPTGNTAPSGPTATDTSRPSSNSGTPNPSGSAAEGTAPTTGSTTSPAPNNPSTSAPNPAANPSPTAANNPAATLAGATDKPQENPILQQALNRSETPDAGEQQLGHIRPDREGSSEGEPTERTTTPPAISAAPPNQPPQSLAVAESTNRFAGGAREMRSIGAKSLSDDGKGTDLLPTTSDDSNTKGARRDLRSDLLTGVFQKEDQLAGLLTSERTPGPKTEIEEGTPPAPAAELAKDTEAPEATKREAPLKLAVENPSALITEAGLAANANSLLAKLTALIEKEKLRKLQAKGHALPEAYGMSAWKRLGERFRLPGAISRFLTDFFTFDRAALAASGGAQHPLLWGVLWLELLALLGILVYSLFQSRLKRVARRHS